MISRKPINNIRDLASATVVAALGGIVLLLAFGWLAWQNYQHRDQQWQAQLTAQAEVQRLAVGVARESLKRQAQILVELVAADKRVIALIREGQAVVQAEGGGQGGVRSTAVRERLNTLLAPYWQTLKARGARQLHAHLAPDATTLLRAHRPELFGDGLAEIRPLVMAVLESGNPRTAMEVGRHGSGLRAVLPVRAEDRPDSAVIGALEVGFDLLPEMRDLDGQLNAGFALLLRQEADKLLLEQGRAMLIKDVRGNWLLDSFSRPEVGEWIKQGLLPSPAEFGKQMLLRTAGRDYLLQAIPLPDFQSERDPSRPALAAVLVWQDITQALSAKEATDRAAWGNWILALLAAELLLFLLWHTTRQVARREAQTREAELRELNASLEQSVAERTREARESEEKLRLFVHHAPAAIAMFDREMRYVAFSRRWLTDYNLGNKDLTGRSHYELFPDLPGRWKEIHRRCLAGAIEKADEEPFPRGDGSVDWVRWEVHPWRASDSRIGGIIIFSEVITERKRAEDEIRALSANLERRVAQRTAQLAESEGRMRLLLASTGEAIYGIDRKGDCTFCNPACMKVLGYRDEAELLRRNMHALIHHHRADGSPYPVHECPIFRTFREGGAATVEGEVFWRADGSSVPVEYSAYPLATSGEIAGTVVVFRDVSERKRTEELLRAHRRQIEAQNEALARANAQLVYANRAKDSFLAVMSHEVRTPLGGLLGMLELLALSPLDREQRETLQAARASGQSLARIVDDILDWSKIEAGKLALAPTAALVSEIVTGVVETYARLASTKGLLLRQYVDPDLSPAVIVDPLRLSQVLNNFVSNAIKFTKDGEVEIRAELLDRDEGAERVRFSVRDTGLGMDKALQDRLFQSYVQGNAETARMYGGTGLGLAICRRLADLMNGQIDVQSTPGKGSIFSLTLSLLVAAQAPGQDVGPSVRDTTATTAIKPLVPESAAARAPLVLVVDDHPTNRELLARQVRLLGLRAETADGGVSALRRWREGSFDMVITDCHMPELDGYALTRAIRELEARESRHRSPIIAWTASVLSDEAERCREAGMDDLLTKPTGMAWLRTTLEKWLPAIEKCVTDEPGTEAGEVGPDTEPPIDFAQLAEVAADRAEQIEILRGFQAHNPGELRELKEALAARDLAAVARSAHRLKGASQLVGAKQIAAVCAAIEAAARRGDAEAALASGALLDRAVQSFDDQLAAQAGERRNS